MKAKYWYWYCCCCCGLSTIAVDEICNFKHLNWWTNPQKIFVVIVNMSIGLGLAVHTSQGLPGVVGRECEEVERISN